MSDGRILLVDASVLITLAEVGSLELLRGLDGRPTVPRAVRDGVESDPAQSRLKEAVGDWLDVRAVLADDGSGSPSDAVSDARAQLGVPAGPDAAGDVALLAAALQERRAREQAAVVVTDDKPLRQTCKALSVPVSGSIGVLVRAVERGALDPDGAKDKLLAMDEVGARLSASLVRRAERLIDDAASE